MHLRFVVFISGKSVRCMRVGMLIASDLSRFNTGQLHLCAQHAPHAMQSNSTP